MSAKIARLLVIYPSLPLLGIGAYVAVIRFWRSFTEPWNLWWALWDTCTLIIVAIIGWLVFRLPPQIPNWRTWLYIGAIFIGDIGLVGLVWNLRRNIEPKEGK